MPAPSTSIDFARDFSLPLGVPTPLAAADLATYLAQLGAHAGSMYLDRPGRVEHDPGNPTRRLLRQLPLANDAARSVLLPRTTKNFGATFEPSAAAIDAIAKRRVAAAVAAPPASLAEVASRQFRWDDVARQAAAAPLPVFADESVVIDWPLAGAAAGAVGQAVPGVWNDVASTHLLATVPAARDGELDPTLLRCPVVGLVRFERYRHISSAGGVLSVLRPSQAGAVVIQALAGGAAMPAHGAPIFRKHLVVLEHVATASAVECLAALTWCQLTHRAAIRAQAALKKAWATTVTALLTSWLAWLETVPGAATTDPLASVPAAELVPFQRGFGTGAAAAAPVPTAAQLEDLIASVLADPTAKTSLQGYVRTVFAPLLCGGSWKEIGVDLPVAPTSPRTPLQSRAHRVLEALMNSADTWLPVYAGCPVGRPARFYAIDATPLAQRTLAPLERLTTFDLEALLISEWVELSIPGISAPALPDRFHAPVLTAYDGLPGGRLAALRIVDVGGGGALLLTRDWLDICTQGSNARGRYAAPLDFEPFAAAGHPLAPVLDWPTVSKAALARQRLDTLRTSNVQGRNVTVAAANLAWWVACANVDVGGLWPVTLPGIGPPATPPTPSNPYGLGATNIALLPGLFNEPSGFDETDLAAALGACAVVRNGRTLVADLQPALVLAVLDREGLKSVGGLERTAQLRDFGNDPALAGWSALDFLDFAVQKWLIFPFGLDLLVLGRVDNVNGHPFQQNVNLGNFAALFRSTVAVMGQRYVDAGILPPNEPSLGPERMLASLRRRRLRVPPGLRLLTRSRSALALGVIWQQATFQWVHQRLSLATRPLGAPVPAVEDFAWVRVDELVNGAPPPPGANANSAERRRYLAYWGLVYLAFNTSPPTWNRWVNAVPAAALAAGTTIGEYLVFHRNADPAALEPPGAGRTRGQRGNMLRFVTGLDAYLRMNLGGPAPDLLDPQARAWPVI